MGNMSYCRFENTLSDLRDCYENMEDSLSNTEQQARQSIIKLCMKISEEYGFDHNYDLEAKADYSASADDYSLPEDQLVAYYEFEDICEETGQRPREFHPVKEALTAIGYNGVELYETLSKVARAPVVKECLENGVISTRSDLESVLLSAVKCAPTKTQSL